MNSLNGPVWIIMISICFILLKMEISILMKDWIVSAGDFRRKRKER